MKSSIETSNLEIIRASEAARLLGVSQVTINRWCKDPQVDFPKRIKLGRNAVGFLKADLVEYIRKGQEYYDDKRGDRLPKSLQSSSEKLKSN